MRPFIEPLLTFIRPPNCQNLTDLDFNCQNMPIFAPFSTLFQTQYFGAIRLPIAVCMCVKQNGNLLPFQLESGSGPLVMKKESKDSKSRPLDKLRQAICHERD